MNTTAQYESAGEDTAQLLERLTSVDPADAPSIADELATRLASGLDAASAPRQLEAEFDAGDAR